MMKNTSVVVLAAGRGTRMGGYKPKVLREIAGKPLIYWTLKNIQNLGVSSIYVVLGYRSSMVRKEIIKMGFDNLIFVYQKSLLGTAHSLKVALKEIPSNISNVIVLFGDDSAFYSTDTLFDILDFHKANKNIGTFLVSNLDKPNSVGGLVLKGENVVGINTKDEIISSKTQKYPVLCGMFCFNRDWINKNISKIKKNLSSGEYPLPKIYEVALLHGNYIKSYPLKNGNEWMSVNTPEELEDAHERMLNLLKS